MKHTTTQPHKIRNGRFACHTHNSNKIKDNKNAPLHLLLFVAPLHPQMSTKQKRKVPKKGFMTLKKRKKKMEKWKTMTRH